MSKQEFKELPEEYISTLEKDCVSNQKANSNHPVFSLIQNMYQSLKTINIIGSQTLPSHSSYSVLFIQLLLFLRCPLRQSFQCLFHSGDGVFHARRPISLPQRFQESLLGSQLLSVV